MGVARHQTLCVTTDIDLWTPRFKYQECLTTDHRYHESHEGDLKHDEDAM